MTKREWRSSSPLMCRENPFRKINRSDDWSAQMFLRTSSIEVSLKDLPRDRRRTGAIRRDIVRVKPFEGVEAIVRSSFVMRL